MSSPDVAVPFELLVIIPIAAVIVAVTAYHLATHNRDRAARSTGRP